MTPQAIIDLAEIWYVILCPGIAEAFIDFVECVTISWKGGFAPKDLETWLLS